MSSGAKIVLIDFWTTEDFSRWVSGKTLPDDWDKKENNTAKKRKKKFSFISSASIIAAAKQDIWSA